MSSSSASSAAASMDQLPNYNSLFPLQDQRPTNRSHEARRRYTTITLREIYYPGGCPCHPVPPPLSKKNKKDKKNKPNQPPPPDLFDINESLWLGHARPVFTERSASQSSGSSSSSTNSSNSTNSSRHTATNRNSNSQPIDTISSSASKSSKARQWGLFSRRMSSTS